jgi:hypothetical protein
MNLKTLAEADGAIVLEDADDGFAVPVTLTIPAVDIYSEPVVLQVNGIYNRIGVFFDPDTGIQVPGDTSAVTVRLSSIAPHEPNGTWTISVQDITGATITGKPMKPLFDRSLGCVTMFFKRG